MNLFTSLVQRLSSQKAEPTSDYPGQWVSISSGEPGVNQANLLEANREWVYIAVNKNATSMQGVRFKVMRFSRNGDDQEVFKGPMVDFLEAPAPNFTGKDFIYLNTVYKELTGNAFWEKLTGRKVAPLIPTRVTPVIESGKLTGYKVSDGGKQRTIAVKDVLHDRHIDPARPFWGVGKLQKIARWADTSAYLTEFLSRFFVNGATFGGFIETEEETEARIKLIKLGLVNDHVGVANAHKIGVLPKGSKFSKVTANMAEMELGETDDRYRDKILAAFGVPKTLVGLTTEVNRASAEASEYIYAKHTLKPLADDFVEFLNTNVAAMLDATGQFYFAYDEFVPEDKELKQKERAAALNNQPYMTVNEVRATAGLPPVQGGDTIYSAPGVPLGEPIIAPEPANDDDMDEDKEPKKAIPSRARAAFTSERMVESILEKAIEVTTAHHDPDEESHKAFVSRAESFQQLLAGSVRDFNNRQERDVAQRLKQITKAVQKGDVFDMDGEVSVLVDFVSPILKGLMLEQAVEEYLAQEFPGQLDQAKPRFAEIVASAARRLAKTYNKTTAKLITSTLNEGIGKGEDLTQLTERVKAVYEYSNSVRAEMVAHTEAFYIANEGSREAYRQSGVVKSMRWYTAEDERVCPFCGPENGRVIGVNEVFFKKGDTLEADGKELKLDYRTIDVPPLHVRCRCFIRPEQAMV